MGGWVASARSVIVVVIITTSSTSVAAEVRRVSTHPSVASTAPIQSSCGCGGAGFGGTEAGAYSSVSTLSVDSPSDDRYFASVDRMSVRPAEDAFVPSAVACGAA